MNWNQISKNRCVYTILIIDFEWNCSLYIFWFTLNWLVTSCASWTFRKQWQTQEKRSSLGLTDRRGRVGADGGHSWVLFVIVWFQTGQTGQTDRLRIWTWSCCWSAAFLWSPTSFVHGFPNQPSLVFPPSCVTRTRELRTRASPVSDRFFYFALFKLNFSPPLCSLVKQRT